MDGDDPAAAQDEAVVSMDVDAAVVEEVRVDVTGDGGLASVAAVGRADTTALLMSAEAPPSPSAATTGVDPGDGTSQTADPPALGAAEANQREADPEKLSNGGPPAAAGRVGPAVGSEALGAAEASGANDPPAPQLASNHHLETLSAEQSSFDQGRDMSVDEEDTDAQSDRASSVDAQQSDHDVVPPPQDQYQADQIDERTPLENIYMPFIHPTDTCLADARKRLRVALEQTRILRASFTEQAYERYICVMKPVPESLNEILEPIQMDPNQVGVALREQAYAIKVEKDMEKKQAQQAGVGLEELAYFGEGLHLVVLPEDEVDETDIDFAQFPHRGPTDPETGERREEISAAAASSTEQVFDRIRRIRAIRMGADIVPGADIPDTVTHLTRNPAQDQEALNESFSPGFPVAPLASSPAPSEDSNAGDNNQRPSKDSLQHLLTLAPYAEGARPDGSFTAVQSALIARGVGMNEMKRDDRINPLRQRMVQPNYFSPTPSYKFLPPLLGPHQLYRLQAADARKEGLEVRSSARESIKSVVEEICSTVDKGKCLEENDRLEDGSGGDSGSGGIGRAQGEDCSALEIGLLRRMRSAMLENQRDKSTPAATSGSATHAVAESTDPIVESMRSGSDTGDFDPLLAFSVMNAVGLVRKKQDSDKDREDSSGRPPENAAQALGLHGLVGLDTVSKFFHTNSTTGNGRKRPLSGTDDARNDAKKAKLESGDTDNGGTENEGVYQIRGGGRLDDANAIESKTIPKETGEMNKQKKNGVSQMKNKSDVALPDPSLAGYAGFDQPFNPMSQVPLGNKQSQSVIAAAAASRQLLQHQLSVHPDPYHTAALAPQLTGPIGSQLGSLPASDLSELYLRNGLARNPEWSALQTTNPVARADVMADVMAHHPQLTGALGLLPGQINLSLSEQEAARAILLRDHHNAAAARAHGAVTAAAAAHYQAAFSSISPQIPFGFVESSLSQLRSNETQSISSLPVSHENLRNILQRKRSSSLSEQSPRNKISKEINGHDAGKSDEVADMKRPASAPPSPQNFELNNAAPDGGSRASKRIVSHDEATVSERSFAIPTPPVGLQQDIADLITHAKFHEAHSLSQKKSDESEALLIKFLLSLGAAVPIPKEFIANPLVKKLSSSNYQLRLHEFVGSSSTASASRDVIIAIISIWLWAEHEDCFKQAIAESGKKEADPNCKWLIYLAIDKSLSALATFFDSHPSGKNDGQTKETPNEKVAAIASQSLANQVFVDNRADASFPILEDLHKLLDSLRTDALQAKTQERVLLAALASRCGNMSEAFSNAYVSSIVRAGVALGHENVCDIAQDEECRASTMLPYDFFHDNVGVWEEPCRPTTGFHSAVGGDELKKQAHARSVIQKSLKRLQNSLGLKGGISDGGPYFPASSMNAPAPPTPTVAPPLMRTPSGSLKRRGSYDSAGVSGSGPDTIFNPEHHVVPMLWNRNDMQNFPYGQHQLGDHPFGNDVSEKKRRKLSHSKDGAPGDQAASLTVQYRSTQELEWEDVANMFFHGGSTRNIDINYDFGSSDHLGKKKIFAPFVGSFDPSTLKSERETEIETYSDEDVTDETVLQRHQGVLDEMRLKLDAALENRKHQSQQRGRKR